MKSRLGFLHNFNRSRDDVLVWSRTSEGTNTFCLSVFLSLTRTFTFATHTLDKQKTGSKEVQFLREKLIKLVGRKSALMLCETTELIKCTNVEASSLITLEDLNGDFSIKPFE